MTTTRVYLKEGDFVNVSATTFDVVLNDGESWALEFDSIGDGADVEFWDVEDQRYYEVHDDTDSHPYRMYYNREVTL